MPRCLELTRHVICWGLLDFVAPRCAILQCALFLPLPRTGGTALLRRCSSEIGSVCFLSQAHACRYMRVLVVDLSSTFSLARQLPMLCRFAWGRLRSCARCGSAAWEATTLPRVTAHCIDVEVVPDLSWLSILGSRCCLFVRKLAGKLVSFAQADAEATRKSKLLETGRCPSRAFSPYLSVSLRVCVCVSACLRVCVSACLRVCVSACLRVCVSACLRVCVSSCLRVCVSACLRVCVSRARECFLFLAQAATL